MDDPAGVVRRYLEIVADLRSTPDALLEVLAPDVRVIERPNAMNPRGHVRDREDVLAGFRAGKDLLATQRIDIAELLVTGDRVAVRATWRGTIAGAAGPLPAGAELIAHVAAWFTVAAGRIREHETFDCYEPFAAHPASGA